MSDFIKTRIRNNIGFIALDRPKALNSLSLDMIRSLTATLLAWREDKNLHAVVIRSTTEKAFCAGGDIRFFYEAAGATPSGGSALLEDFFTEEYALNHLIQHFPKPYVALMDGIVMGGGMGISQGSASMRIVTERTRMAMPEVNIGLFPDVGGSYFLSRSPGHIGAYLAVTGEIVNGADALYAGLADVYIPSSRLLQLIDLLETEKHTGIPDAVRSFAASCCRDIEPIPGALEERRAVIDRHFSHNSVSEIVESLAKDESEFSEMTLAAMRKRSPLMMCVAREQIRRGVHMGIADCLRMERSMVRRTFEHREVLEGIRAAVIDKDNSPTWCPPTLALVSSDMVARFFEPAWPDYAHPLRHLS